MLSAALEANRQLPELAERQRAELAVLREMNARLLERDAEREAELESVSEALGVDLDGLRWKRDRGGPTTSMETVLLISSACRVH
jgi:hypothetical protein